MLLNLWPARRCSSRPGIAIYRMTRPSTGNTPTRGTWELQTDRGSRFGGKSDRTSFICLKRETKTDSEMSEGKNWTMRWQHFDSLQIFHHYLKSNMSLRSCEILCDRRSNSTNSCDSCSASEEESSLPKTNPLKHKTEFCKTFTLLGYCNYGHKCRFAHCSE